MGKECRTQFLSLPPARQRRRPVPAARLVLLHDLRGPEGGGHGLCTQHGVIPLDRWRQDVRVAPGDARRPSRSLDRSAESGPAHQRQRRRCERFHRCRPYLDHGEQSAPRPSSTTSRWTTLFPITSTARSRITPTAASPAGRTRASSVGRTGLKRAAASAASLSPIPGTGTSFIPAARATSSATTSGRINHRTSASGRSTTPVMARPT